MAEDYEKVYSNIRLKILPYKDFEKFIIGEKKGAQKELLKEVESKLKIKLDSKEYPQSLNEWELINIFEKIKRGQ
jgi:hypothetical protein